MSHLLYGSTAGQACALERAIRERAEMLVEDQRQQGEQTVERIERESADRIRAQETRASQAAQAEAERAVRRKTQAGEIHLQAELDRLRWELVGEVLAQIPDQLAALTKDENRYLPWFHHLLQEGAAAIERDELIAEVTPRDFHRLHPRWPAIIGMQAPGKTITLERLENEDCLGGVMLYSADRRVRVDNTLRGLIQQRDEALRQMILVRLFPGQEDSGLHPRG